MPVMDGYDTIRAIRETGLHRHLPMIAVTGKVTAGERKRCMDAGADGYVPKPVDTAELFARAAALAAAGRAAGAGAPTELAGTDRPRRVPVAIEGSLKGRGSSWSMTTSATSSP